MLFRSLALTFLIGYLPIEVLNITGLGLIDFLQDNGELAEWLRQRFAKPSFRNGCIGSIPILSAIGV